MAGLTCAEALAERGAKVVLFDKGRAPGGRMSTRRVQTELGEAGFDHGAQYFTVRDLAFRARVDRWHAGGQAAPWPAAGPDAWVGMPGMNAPVKQMAAAQAVRWSRQVERLERDGDGWRIGEEPFDAVLLAIPAEQAGPLLRPWHEVFAAVAANTLSAPCWTVMAAFAERLPIAADVLRAGGPVNGPVEEPIGWAARNSAKPGRSGPESWVIQAEPGWSQRHLEHAAPDVVAPLLDAFARRAGITLPAALTATAHRWRYARSGNAGSSASGNAGSNASGNAGSSASGNAGSGALWDAALGLGVCGDWLLGPRVEAAFLSGLRLAGLMADARLTP
jgi:hypothetical protein